jgi:two-component system chemotaxis response regulator CheY
MGIEDTKFLVVDDFSTMRRIVRNLLKELGFANVQEAEDGVDALNKLRGEKFDFVVSDWNMPNMTGIELLGAMRSEGYGTPFAFVTSEGSPEMRETAEQAGALFLIAKPFTAESFRDAIEPVLA